MEELYLNRYFVNDGKIDVYVTEWGEKDKPIIFCLHGLGSTSLSFIEVAEKLKMIIELFLLMLLDMERHRHFRNQKNTKCHPL